MTDTTHRSNAALRSAVLTVTYFVENIRNTLFVEYFVLKAYVKKLSKEGHCLKPRKDISSLV